MQGSRGVLVDKVREMVLLVVEGRGVGSVGARGLISLIGMHSWTSTHTDTYPDKCTCIALHSWVCEDRTVVPGSVERLRSSAVEVCFFMSASWPFYLSRRHLHLTLSLSAYLFFTASPWQLALTFKHALSYLLHLSRRVCLTAGYRNVTDSADSSDNCFRRTRCSEKSSRSTAVGLKDRLASGRQWSNRKPTYSKLPNIFYCCFITFFIITLLYN